MNIERRKLLTLQLPEQKPRPRRELTNDDMVTAGLKSLGTGAFLTAGVLIFVASLRGRGRPPGNHKS